MEKSNSQNSNIMGTVGANDECLFYPTSPNERMIQENLQKVQKGTQTILMPPLSTSKTPRSNLDAHTETKNDSIFNASLYDSFSADESKYDSFDDSLDEEAAHLSPKRINVSNFLSEQVNVTVRKIRDRKVTKCSNLCDSLEDICSLVSNAEHLSTSDEIEFISNVLEKHGICEDSLRNDVCYDNKHASLNELNFDDDSLAILEVEKPFDDSLEDIDVVSCVDSLMILGNSIGDTDVIVDKLVSENCGGTRNHLETSVQIIYENAPISSDESFRTAENFNSNKNSLSDCAMSRDSLEEIHDISEIASSEKSSNIPVKGVYDLNEPSPAKKTADVESFNENVLECEVKRTSSELINNSQSRFSNAESERTSSVVNSCYFYDTFCMDDSVQLPPEFDNKEPNEEMADSKFLNERNLKLVSEFTEKSPESNNKCLSSPSYFQDMDENQTSKSADLSSTSECLEDKIDNTSLKTEKETSQAAIIPFCEPLHKSSSRFLTGENKNSVIGDSNLSPFSSQTKNMLSISDTASENECCPNNVDKLEVQVLKTDLLDSGSFSQTVVAEEHCKKVSQCSHDSVCVTPQKSIKNILTCITVSPSIGKLGKHNVTSAKSSCKNDVVENSKSGTDQMNLKLHIELAINKNCDVNVVSVSSEEQEAQNEANMPLGKSCIVAKNINDATSSALKNQANQLKIANSKHEIDTLEKIMTTAQKKIPTLSNVSEHENLYNNQQKLIFTSKTCNDNTDQIKLGVCNAQLLQALDLHDSSFSCTSEQHLQSRDSLMPLNLCTRDLFPEKRNDVLESKENIPYFQKCKKSPGDDKGTFLHSKNKPQGLKKTVGKQCLITKIPIRKAESPLSIPVNQKQIKQDFRSSPGGKQVITPLTKSASVNSIGKTCLDEMSRKHHFCTVRNSICRVPKSLEKWNAKKFQNIQSPVAKYIENGKVPSPLKTTHRYDGNLISPLPSRLTPKAAGNASVSVSEASVAKKSIRRLKS